MSAKTVIHKWRGWHRNCCSTPKSRGQQFRESTQHKGTVINCCIHTCVSKWQGECTQPKLIPIWNTFDDKARNVYCWSRKPQALVLWNVLQNSGVAQWVASLTRNRSVVGSRPITSSRCFLEQETFPSLLIVGDPGSYKVWERWSEHKVLNMQKSSLQRLMLHAVERLTNFHRTFNTFGYYYSVVNLAYIGYHWCSQCFLCSEQLVCNLSTTTARTLAHNAWK